MAPQKRTRQQVGDLSSESLPRKPPAKRIKTRTWESPPEFRDRLSKIALTHGALRELDRRTELSRTGLPRSRHSLACTTSPVKHPSPPAPDPTPVIMTSRHSSTSATLDFWFLGYFNETSVLVQYLSRQPGNKQFTACEVRSAITAHDPSRWSHSDGEAQRYNGGISAVTPRSSGSSGVLGRQRWVWAGTQPT
ncbi:hypothetical protein HYQ46_003536 [Verticillium longisporum]|nr:hypothetical protein HYQ46_003536 [Verticillium longisporum]